MSFMHILEPCATSFSGIFCYNTEIYLRFRDFFKDFKEKIFLNVYEIFSSDWPLAIMHVTFIGHLRMY